MSAFGTITALQLHRLIGTPDAPAIIDVRDAEDFAADPRLLPCALRAAHETVTDLAPALAGRAVVVVCQKGLKLSEGAAAMLRTLGIAAEVLEGGWLAALEAGLPALPAHLLPPAGAASVWVTRQRPKIDRIACPWLIRRFVDPGAVFLFVAPAETLAVAERFGATPFDVDDTFWSHRGERCTFDVMLEEFGLRSPALDRLALIVRAADTARPALAPEAAGLLAASLGLSRMYRDDLAQLEAGMGLYDAFHRWARDATAETHNWPAGKPA